MSMLKNLHAYIFVCTDCRSVIRTWVVYITNVKKVAIYLSLGQLKTEPSSLRSTSVTSSSISDFTERVTTEEEQNIPTTFATGQPAITNTTVIPNESSRPTATLLHHKKTTVGSAVASHGTEKNGNYCLKRISKFSIEALMITSLIKNLRNILFIISLAIICH